MCTVNRVLINSEGQKWKETEAGKAVSEQSIENGEVPVKRQPELVKVFDPLTLSFLKNKLLQGCKILCSICSKHILITAIFACMLYIYVEFLSFQLIKYFLINCRNYVNIFEAVAPL